MARILLNQVSRQFNNAAAVESITFEVPEGEFWVLVGPSGCGKSTTLRMIAGLEFPTSGEIYIGDRLVNQVPARSRDVAMVFQNYALYPHMTVAENMAFGLRLRGVDRLTIEQNIQATAQSLNIAHLLQRKPGQLSGGQQQRVALGRAIVRQPQAFLLDEPLSNLDAQLRDETRAELKQLHHKFGITTIYVTHDQVEAMTLADQIVVLDQGKVQQISDPQTLYAQPINQMVAMFVGSPPMNILPAQYDGSQFHIGDFQLPCPVELQSRLAHGRNAVNLGIRPEHLQVGTTGLPVRVTLIEPLGRESLVRSSLSGAESIPVQFWLTAEQSVRTGESLLLQIDLQQLQVFDPISGKNLALSET